MIRQKSAEARVQPTDAWLECETCGGGLPGVIMPLDIHGNYDTCLSEDGRVFVERCGECALFTDDEAAAMFVARLIGRPYRKHFDQPPEPYFYCYLPMTCYAAEQIMRFVPVKDIDLDDPGPRGPVKRTS